MKYKMLVLDMDGTLLSEDQTISLKNKEAIHRARQAGIHVVLASGRHFNGLLSYIKELDLLGPDCFSVSCSGAVVTHNASGRVIYEEHIDPMDVVELYESCENLGLDLCGYTHEGLVLQHESLFSRYDSIANQSPLIHVDFSRVNKELLIYKMNIINESPVNRQEIIDYFPRMTLEDYSVRDKGPFHENLLNELWRLPENIRESYNIVRPLPFIAELFHKHSNKAVGMEAIASRLGLGLDQVVAIGDSGNDVHMLEEAGLGIAMENARDEAKAAADVITLSNDDHGVAEAIFRFLLKDEE